MSDDRLKIVFTDEFHKQRHAERRERIATAIIGHLSDYYPERAAQEAVAHADALIAELDRKAEP